MPKKKRGGKNRTKKVIDLTARSEAESNGSHERHANVFSKSEFPSLGGGAQPQPQNAGPTTGASYWGANNARPRSPERYNPRAPFGRGAGARVSAAAF